MLFDKNENKPLKFYGTEQNAKDARESGFGGATEENCVISIAYFMYYKTGLDDAGLTQLENFSNDQKADFTEVVSASEASLTVGAETFTSVDCYYFQYTLDVSNYGSIGDSSGQRKYENKRFSYYPYSYNKKDEGYATATVDDKKLYALLNTGDDENIYYRKPVNVDEYKAMLAKFDEDAAGKVNQFVNLDEKFAIVEFGSKLITLASADRGLEGPGM